MRNSNSLIYDIWLSCVVMSNPKYIETALSTYKDAGEVYKDRGAKCDFGRCDGKIKEYMERTDISRAEKVIELCSSNSIKIVRYDDDNYPFYLFNCSPRPYILYMKGNTELLKAPLITITGSRKANNEGKSNAEYFTKKISEAGIGVVTGFADGTEETVINSVSRVITVLPCGILKPYPANHACLIDKIIQKGGLVVSPFEPTLVAYKWNFYFRNKILAGISEATFIVQASENSATSMVFNNCGDFGRVCYALPGGINDGHYVKTNEYLKEGASIVTSPDDIIYDYAIKYANVNMKKQEKQEECIISESQQKIVKALQEKELDVNQLCNITGLNINNIVTDILELELSDMIIRTESEKFRLKTGKG